MELRHLEEKNLDEKGRRHMSLVVSVRAECLERQPKREARIMSPADEPLVVERSGIEAYGY
jgi:hypothetical protein